MTTSLTPTLRVVPACRARLFWASAFCGLLAACASLNAQSDGNPAPVDAASPAHDAARRDGAPLGPLPALAEWEANMTTYGAQWCDYLRNHSGDPALLASYYDAEWVYYQIGDYTGDAARWSDCARQAEIAYRDAYLVPNNYRTPGYWRFPHGLYEDFRRGSDTGVQALRDIRDQPAFSDPDTSEYAATWYHASTAREIAYGIHAQLTAEKAGEPRSPRLGIYLAMSRNHLDQWQTGDYTLRTGVVSGGDLDYFQPFMAGLVCHALIDFYEWEVENGRDPSLLFPDLPGRLRSFLDWMWDAPMVGTSPAGTMRIDDYQGSGHTLFRYVDRCVLAEGCDPAQGTRTPDQVSSGTPDLMLLIAPAYAWVGKHYADTFYLTERGDLLWTAGVSLSADALAWGGKQFNQNYRWSFEYVRWRAEL